MTKEIEIAEPIPNKGIEYPYMPEGRTILYVSETNEYMQSAKEYAKEYSLDNSMPTASVIVKDGAIVGKGANGSDYHKQNQCERVKLGVPTGQGYELCEGCHPKNHSETKAVKNARENNTDPQDADLYLWGHWWCCRPCWESIIDAGIKNVYLLEGSESLFNKIRSAAADTK